MVFAKVNWRRMRYGSYVSHCDQSAPEDVSRKAFGGSIQAYSLRRVSRCLGHATESFSQHPCKNLGCAEVRRKLANFRLTIKAVKGGLANDRKDGSDLVDNGKALHVLDLVAYRFQPSPQSSLCFCIGR
jgi:hypothetical protein